MVFNGQAVAFDQDGNRWLVFIRFAVYYWQLVFYKNDCSRLCKYQKCVLLEIFGVHVGACISLSKRSRSFYRSQKGRNNSRSIKHTNTKFACSMGFFTMADRVVL